jgi:hypothetical protein
MTAPEQTDFEDWPVAPDLIRMAALPLIEHIFAVTADGSAERGKAMDVALAAIERIRAALHRPRLN